jgi:hypothetical protein
MRQVLTANRTAGRIPDNAAQVAAEGYIRSANKSPQSQ